MDAVLINSDVSPRTRPPRSTRSSTRRLLLSALALTLLAGVSGREISDASAVTPLTADVGGVHYELSADNIVGITDTANNMRMEDNPDAGPQDATVESANTAITQMLGTVKSNFGWDLSQEADQTKAEQELSALYDEIRKIPDAVIQKEENKAFLELRDVLNALSGNEVCRARCLPNLPDTTTILAVVVGGAVQKILSDWSPHTAGANIAALAVGAFVVRFVNFYVRVRGQLGGVPLRDLQAKIAMVTAGAMIISNQFLKQAKEIEELKTIVESLRKAAEQVKTVEPSNDATRTDDYDMIKDEL